MSIAFDKPSTSDNPLQLLQWHLDRVVHARYSELDPRGNQKSVREGVTNPRIIRLKENEPLELERHELEESDALTIYHDFGKRIDVDFPSPKTSGRWRLRSLGWVGSIPIGRNLRIVIEPKIPMASLFRMLEYSYDLKSFEIFKGESSSIALEEIYQRVADILALRVLDRARRGFYRTYVSQEDELPYVRGSLDLARSLRSPWNVGLHCSFQEQTTDVGENRLLAWTLHTIVRQNLCTGATLERVRAAWQMLRGVAALHPFRAADCLDQLYNRLNDDYRRLHALCRFFLEQTGPTHEPGDHEMLPFLVDMPRLYEEYVAEYLKEHLPEKYSLSVQQRVSLDGIGGISIVIDMVLIDRVTGETVAVLDTKYKDVVAPSSDDLQQIVAYAVARNCRRGVLIYPVMLRSPFNGMYGEGDVEVVTLTVSPPSASLRSLRPPLW